MRDDGGRLSDAQDPTRAHALPVDPDVEASASDRLSGAGPLCQQVRQVFAARWDILVVAAAGGALGSLARWGLGQAMTTPPGGFPWATLLVNVSGAFAIGVLMVFVLDVWPPSRLVRPFLGVGVLGGFTTVSTYMLDTRALIVDDRAALAAIYLFGTLVAGLAAVWAGILLARLATRRALS